MPQGVKSDFREVMLLQQSLKAFGYVGPIHRAVIVITKNQIVILVLVLGRFRSRISLVLAVSSDGIFSRFIINIFDRLLVFHNRRSTALRGSGMGISRMDSFSAP
ncbi:MAG: hypothetical protein PHT79_11650 [Syntrophomonadaceae bacterium]|nr:hypothetical protein [Syntrophomonadaceae bacterium]MDD4550400.1 hypothetical protein [Syntrophomonadaceae bacterium]